MCDLRSRSNPLFSPAACGRWSPPRLTSLSLTRSSWANFEFSLSFWSREPTATRSKGRRVSHNSRALHHQVRWRPPTHKHALGGATGLEAFIHLPSKKLTASRLELLQNAWFPPKRLFFDFAWACHQNSLDVGAQRPTEGSVVDVSRRFLIFHEYE